MLQAAIFFQGFHVLRQVLQTYSEICIFCSAIQYIVPKKQPVGKAHDVLVESLETVFDEAQFIVNLNSFLQPLALSWHSFPNVSHLSPNPPGRTTFKTPHLQKHQKQP